MTDVVDEKSNIVDFPDGATKGKKVEKIWGKAVIACGFTITPSLLIQGQRRLGLSPLQMNIVLHLLDFWWDPDRKPFPSKAEIAERIGVHPRTIQKNIAEMEGQGLIHRVQRFTPAGDPSTNIYDLTGLVKRLKKLEPEFRKVKEERKELRRTVATPKGRRRAKAPE